MANSMPSSLDSTTKPDHSKPMEQIIHSQKAAAYIGSYVPEVSVLRNSYYNLGMINTPDEEVLDRFGRIEVVHNGVDLKSPGESFFVRNLQFDIGGGKPGLLILPVDDTNKGENASNRKTESYIRKQIGVSDGHLAPYEIIYTHPETNGPQGEGRWEEFPGEGRKGTLKTIADQGGVAQGSATHRGGAVGFQGVTHNSPEGYHDDQFKVINYPAIAINMSIKGTHPDVVASQRNRASFLLADGVNFSSRPYKNDFVRVKDVNTVLMFTRDWIIYRAMKRLQEGTFDSTDRVQAIVNELGSQEIQEYLESDEWTTYCGEHRAAVDYLMTSLQFTEEGFKEVYDNTSMWGQVPTDLGAKLFFLYGKVITAKAKKQGVPFKEKGQMQNGISPDSWCSTSGSDTGYFFRPLWKRMGFTSDDIRPFDSPLQFDEYEIALLNGSINQYRVKWGSYAVIPLPPGKALPYAPQTTADLINVFINKVHRWYDVGGIQTSMAVMAFMGKATERHGISHEDYVKLATPIIGKLLIADALAQGAPDNWFLMAEPTLANFLVKLIPDDATLEHREMFELLLKKVSASAGKILNAQKNTLQSRCSGNPVTRGEVELELAGMIQKEVVNARNIDVGDRTEYVKNNIPPQILLDIIHGLHKPAKIEDWNNGMVEFTYLGTLMDVSQVRVV